MTVRNVEKLLKALTLDANEFDCDALIVLLVSTCVDLLGVAD